MKAVLTNAVDCLTIRGVPKEELIYARISSELKRKLAIETARRGEAEAVIVREALNEFFARREAAAYGLRDAGLNVNPPAASISYRRKKP